MRSQYVAIMVKFQFYKYYIQLVFLETKSLIILICSSLLVKYVPWLKLECEKVG